MLSPSIYFTDDEGTMYEVSSESSDELYIVSWDKYDGWNCICPDYIYRKHECKHIRACKKYAKENDLAFDDKIFMGLANYG